MGLLHFLFGHRMRALILKEFRQMRHDPRVAFSIIIMPTLQLCIFGFVLSATVSNLPLGIVDRSATPESRELIATLTQSRAFQLAGYYDSVNRLGEAIGRGKVDAGVVIPYDYARDLLQGRTATVQFLLNATNANTAAIAQGYAEGVVQSYDTQIAPQLLSGAQVVLQPAYLYNPGLVGSWFMVTGVLGMLLLLNGSILASTMMVKEREAGTIEQLLMSPASTAEIIIAKITPLFLMLSLIAIIAMLAIRYVFHVPFHGNALLVLAGDALCMLSGIGLGMFIATLAKTSQQAQLAIFFLNPPLTSLSGAFTPIEAMPHWLQPFTNLNPIAHFAAIARSVLIRGAGLDSLWPNFLALALFTAVLVTLSIWRYRQQLA